MGNNLFDSPSHKIFIAISYCLAIPFHVSANTQRDDATIEVSQHVSLKNKSRANEYFSPAACRDCDCLLFGIHRSLCSQFHIDINENRFSGDRSRVHNPNEENRLLPILEVTRSNTVNVNARLKHFSLQLHGFPLKPREHRQGSSEGYNPPVSDLREIINRRGLICVLCVLCLLPGFALGDLLIARGRRALGYCIVAAFIGVFNASLALLFLTSFSWSWGWWL